MVSIFSPKTQDSVRSVLRVHNTEQVFVEDVYKYLTDLEYAYNCAYVFDSILEQAEELSEYYSELPPIPIKNLLWISWWPPNPEKVAEMVPPEDKLQLYGVQFNSPSFWDFLGKHNPLEVLCQYLNAQHKRRQEQEYREKIEAKKGWLQIEQIELEIFNRRLELAKQLKVTEQDLAVLQYRLLGQPLEQLNSSQDQRLILEAEIAEIDPKKENIIWTSLSHVKLEIKTFSLEVVKVNKRGEIIEKQKKQAKYFSEKLPGGVELEMVEIPGGNLTMGSPESEEGSNDSERPEHQVSVPRFFMGRYPITQAQWKAIAAMSQMEKELDCDPSRFKGDKRPVEQVSWYDAREFCARLSAHTKRNYRLPSEAEWEYTCRAGTTTPFHFGETISTELANYNGSRAEYGAYGRGDRRGATIEVDFFGVGNAFGLSDMHGNVWEWCADDYYPNYEGAPIDGSAWTSNEDSAIKILRGGGWGDDPQYCRSACRDSFYPLSRYYLVGFRVVCGVSRT